jgi:periplasmic divalent cation tolerance protein
MILIPGFVFNVFMTEIPLMNAMVVLTTTDSAEMAQQIASALVEARAASCVSIVPGVRSIYRWEGKICNEGELLLMIKTTEDKYEGVRSLIRRLHSYQTPEIIALSIAAGDPDYLNWLTEQVGPCKAE